MRGRLIGGAIYIAGAKFIGLGIGLLSTIILARLLMPEDFGLMALAMVFITLINVVSELPLSQAIIQLDDVEESHFDTAWTLSMARGLITAIIILALSFPVALIYSEPRLTAIFFALSLCSIMGGFKNPKISLFIKQLDFKQGVIINLSEKITAFIIAVIIALIFRSYWALVFSVIGAQLVQVLVSYSFISYRPRFSLEKSKDLLGFSVWITLGSWIQTLSWRSDPMVLGFFVTTEMLGQYSMAQRVTNMATKEITSPVGQVLFPAFSRMKAEPKRLRNAYKKSTSIISCIAIPSATGLALLAEPIVQIVIGVKWLPIVPFIQLMAIIVIIQAAVRVRPLAMAVGDTKALFKRDLFTLTVRVPLLFGGIYLGIESSLGVLQGALLGAVVSAFICTIWNMLLVSKVSRVTFLDQCQVFLRPVIASIVMVGCVLWLNNYLDINNFNKVSELVILSTSGFLLYSLTLSITWIVAGKPEGLETLFMQFLSKALSYKRG